MTWVQKPINGPFNKKQSRSSGSFFTGLFCTSLLPGHCTTSVTPTLMYLPLAITFGCHCLGYQSLCPTAGRMPVASWKILQGSHTDTHTSMQTLSGVHKNIHAYKYGRARIKKWSATFVDTNGDNVELLKVRSREIRVAVPH